MAAPRTRLVVAVLLPAALAMLSGAAQAVDFRSVSPGPAVMYDAPGLKSKKVFIAPVGMPLELVLTNGDWSRVRDAGGDLAWIESKYLSTRRTLVVDVPQAAARASASDTAAIVFSAGKGVLLELAEPVSSGWLKVRHRDGDSGYVKASDVWGE